MRCTYFGVEEQQFRYELKTVKNIQSITKTLKLFLPQDIRMINHDGRYIANRTKGL